MTEYLYRYESHNVSLGIDQFDEPIPGHSVSIHLHKYKIIKRTPKGAWIPKYSWSFDSDTEKRFVLLTARKQFASETIEKAKECFIARKKKYIRILESRISDANIAITKVERDKILGEII